MLSVSIEKKLSSFTLSVSFTSSCPSLSLLGQSGSGKSITLKCIAGLIKPDRGRIEYNGTVFFDSEKKINLPPQKRSVGYLFQSYALFPDMSVKKNILAGLKWQKDKSEKMKALEQISKLLNITHILSSKPSSLSGGEAQRTALARMLVNRPSLLLFDEPFSALDAHLRSELQPEFISLMKAFGKDYIIVTHNKEEAYNLSENTIVLDKGEIKESGKTKDVFSTPTSASAARLIGCRNIAEYKNGMVQNWGVKIDLDEKAKSIGVMDDSFYFSGDGYAIDIIEKIENPEKIVILFKFKTPNSPVLWMSAAKGTDIPDNPKVSIEKAFSLSSD